MRNWTNAYCEANGIQVHYTRTGGDKPPLILLHGLMTNGLCWSMLALALEADYDVIMPDARGHGQSEVPNFGYQYTDLASDVVGLINALQLEQPFILGHSMGGMTAAVVAGSHPHLLKSVVLADPTFLSPAMQREVRDSDVAHQHRKVLALSLEEVMADAKARHPHRSTETHELFARARLQTSMAAFDVLTPPNPDYKAVMRKINIPCLLIFGDKGVVTPAVASSLQRRGISIKQIPQAGHSLHMDQPEQFAREVRSFLNNL